MVRYYEILQLRPGASPSQIQQAYRDLVRVWHPDRFAHDPRLQTIAEQKLKEINAAYIALEKLQPEPPLVPKTHLRSTNAFLGIATFLESAAAKHYGDLARGLAARHLRGRGAILRVLEWTGA